MKKKILKTLGICLIIPMCLIGCGNTNKNNDTTKTKKIQKMYTNKQVASDFKKALNDRWDFADEAKEAETFDEAQRQWKDGIQCLTSALDKYTDDDVKFKDTSTQKLIKDFDDIVQMQSTIAEKYTEAPMKYDYNLKAYDERMWIQAKKIVDKLNIQLSKKKSDALISYVNSIKSPTSLIDDALEIKDFKITNRSSYNDIKIKVKNLTNFDFDQASVTVRFYDKDGTVLEDENFYFENLKAYQSMRSENTMSTEDCGNKAEIVSYSFSNKTGPYQYECYESETPFTKPVTKEF